MTHAYRLGTLAAAIAIALGASQTLAENVRAKDKGGFSEIEVPQITGTIPLGRAPADATPKPLSKASSGQPTPNQPVSCGPENAQSVACRDAPRSR
jgi:hypothetical protein